jgi:hypothetical protein
MAVTKVAADLFRFREKKNTAEYFRVQGVYLPLE